MNDARYPWIILVPRRKDVREIHHLTVPDRHRLLDESCAVAQAMEVLFDPVKINIGALGNLVPQLHLHHVVRFLDDPAWPGPVWGHSPPKPYLPANLAAQIAWCEPGFSIRVGLHNEPGAEFPAAETGSRGKSSSIDGINGPQLIGIFDSRMNKK